jgi:hypothetical protein
MRARKRVAPGGACKGAADCAKPAAQVPAQGNQAVLRRLGAGRGMQRRVAPPVVHEVLRGGGRALDAGTRGFFEQGLGADLGAVRVHDNALAARSARAVDAAAYAVGPHVVFDAGRLAPTRPDGLRLLAHELAHVVQSGASGDMPARIRIGEPNAPEEQQATHAAARLSAAQPAGLGAGGAEPALRRQTPDEETKPAPKPLFPLPIVDKFDPVPFVPTPGGTAPSPYDQPGKVTDPSGKGPSLEDLRGAREKLFGKTPLNLGINNNPKMPNCSSLETADSTKAVPKYWTYEQYDVQRRLYHGPLTKDAWPQVTPEQYKAVIDTCPKEVKREMPVIPPPAPLPKGDFPGSTLPPGQAMA